MHSPVLSTAHWPGSADSPGMCVVCMSVCVWGARVCVQESTHVYGCGNVCMGAEHVCIVMCV